MVFYSDREVDDRFTESYRDFGVFFILYVHSNYRNKSIQQNLMQLLLVVLASPKKSKILGNSLTLTSFYTKQTKMNNELDY